MEDAQSMCIAPHERADRQKFIIDQMIKNEILEIGFHYECSGKHKCWYPINKVSEIITCRICGESEKLVDPYRKINWAYQTKGLFRLKNDADGSISVIVALWRLNHDFRNSAYCLSIDINKKQSNDNFEIDYAVLLEGNNEAEPKIILGDAKSNNVIKNLDSLEKGIEVFKELNPAVCISTLKDNFTADEILLIQNFRKRHPFTELLTFVRKQLDTYECDIRIWCSKNSREAL